jgi:hypothetical protein
VSRVKSGRDEWLCGYAAALSCIVRQHDEPGLVVSALVGDGITVTQLEAAGVESFDLDVIKKAVAGASEANKAALSRTKS